MSTRGLIAIMDEDGSSRSIYCHHDMYPSHAGVVLPAHYATREAVEALLSLGDLSALGCSLAECEAYYRDRGEELHKPTHWSDRWVLAREAFDRFWGGVQLPLHGRRVALLRRRRLDARCRLAGVKQN